MDNKMKLSHILYKVKDLHKAVKDFEDMGFTVTYGTKKEKAFNALIWFEEGPFIEVFTVSDSKFLIFLAKLIGKKAVAKRFEHLYHSDYGWVEYSLENDRYDLDRENNKLKEMGYKYSTLNASRKNLKGIKLKWKLSIPLDVGFPFLMSAYKPNPRPKQITHKNGAIGVRELTWGVEPKNIDNIRKLTSDSRLKLVEGNGFKNIEMEGWNAEILNKKYED